MQRELNSFEGSQVGSTTHFSFPFDWHIYLHSKDPSKMTATQMNVLWVAITGGGSESRTLISEHLLSTIDSLIKDAGSKLWKARAGACGALSDVIVGRSWNELGGGGVEVDDEGMFATSPTASIRLIRLWKIAMRAIDDVRTPVREVSLIANRDRRLCELRQMCSNFSFAFSSLATALCSLSARRSIGTRSEGTYDKVMVCISYLSTMLDDVSSTRISIQATQHQPTRNRTQTFSYPTCSETKRSPRRRQSTPLLYRWVGWLSTA